MASIRTSPPSMIAIVQVHLRADDERDLTSLKVVVEGVQGLCDRDKSEVEQSADLRQ